jgi:MFS family permease
MTLAVATTIPAVILIGVFVVGLAISVVSPIGYSLAGDLAPGRSGEASSVVTFVGWGAFIVGPALIGGLAEVGGLRLALATVVLTTGTIAVLAYRVPDVG